MIALFSNNLPRHLGGGKVHSPFSRHLEVVGPSTILLSLQEKNARLPANILFFDPIICKEPCSGCWGISHTDSKMKCQKKGIN